MQSRVFPHEFKTGMVNYLAELKENAVVHSLKEIIEFNEQNREKVMPYFGQEALLNAEKQKPLKPEYYEKAVREIRHATGADGIDAVMHQHRLDAIVAPTAGPPGLNDFSVLLTHGRAVPHLSQRQRDIRTLLFLPGICMVFPLVFPSLRGHTRNHNL